MSGIERIASCLAAAAVVTTIGLAGTVGTAGADKPRGFCTRSYETVTLAEMEERYGDRDGFQELFDSIDKNGDDLLCAKQLPGLYNTVDNVASHRPVPEAQVSSH